MSTGTGCLGRLWSLSLEILKTRWDVLLWVSKGTGPISRGAFPPQPFCDSVNSAAAFLLCQKPPGSLVQQAHWAAFVWLLQAQLRTIQNHW